MQIHVCSLRAVQIKQHVWSDDAKNRIKRAFEWVESIKLQLNYLCDTVWQKPTGVDVHTVISSMPLIFGHWTTTTTTLEERIIIIWSWPLADMRTVTVLVLCCAHEPPNADQWIRSSPSEFLIVCVGVCVCVCIKNQHRDQHLKSCSTVLLVVRSYTRWPRFSCFSCSSFGNAT